MQQITKLVNSKRPHETVIFEKLEVGKYNEYPYRRRHEGDMDGNYYYMKVKEFNRNIEWYLENGFYKIE